MKKFLGGIAFFALPFLALAQGNTSPTLGNLQTLMQSIGTLINMALPIVVALALLFFFWGLAKYILAAGDDEKKKEGRNIMIWGVVALFVMVSVWGLVSFIGNALGIGQGATINSVPGVGGV